MRSTFVELVPSGLGFSCNSIKDCKTSGTKVSRLDEFRFIISLSKVTQMWRHHKFSQRNKVTKRGRLGGEGGGLGVEHKI